MNGLMITSIAAIAAAGAASAAMAQPGCVTPAQASAARAWNGRVYRAEAAQDMAVDTAAHVRDADYARALALYHWRLVRYIYPYGGDYDLIYGPGAFHQNYGLKPRD